MSHNRIFRFLLFSFSISLFSISGCQTDQEIAKTGKAENSGLVFDIEITQESLDRISEMGLEMPVNGRLFVILSDDEESEPRRQVRVSGVPFWGLNIEGLRANQSVTLDPSDDSVVGFPFQNSSKIPSGTYFAQAFLSVYTTFERYDGVTISMHLNSGAG